MKLTLLIWSILWGVMIAMICDLCSADVTAIKTIAYESSNQPMDAQILVGKCIRNRMEQRNLTAQEVCMQPYQFSCWRKDGTPTQKRKLTNDELNNATKAWSLSEHCKSPVNLYHDTSVRPQWAYAKQVKYLGTIGNLMFYNERG